MASAGFRLTGLQGKHPSAQSLWTGRCNRPCIHTCMHAMHAEHTCRAPCTSQMSHAAVPTMTSRSSGLTHSARTAGAFSPAPYGLSSCSVFSSRFSLITPSFTPHRLMAPSAPASQHVSHLRSFRCTLGTHAHRFDMHGLSILAVSARPCLQGWGLLVKAEWTGCVNRAQVVAHRC